MSVLKLKKSFAFFGQLANGIVAKTTWADASRIGEESVFFKDIDEVSRCVIGVKVEHVRAFKDFIKVGGEVAIITIVVLIRLGFKDHDSEVIVDVMVGFESSCDRLVDRVFKGE
jgi:hypothetical protein